MSSEKYEGNGYVHDLDLLITSHLFRASHSTRSRLTLIMCHMTVLAGMKKRDADLSTAVQNCARLEQSLTAMQNCGMDPDTFQSSRNLHCPSVTLKNSFAT